MSYGYFDKNGTCYSITTPQTPTSWKNYIYNDRFMSVVDQVLSGQTKFVINYVQSTFTNGDRRFYIRDRKSGEI